MPQTSLFSILSTAAVILVSIIVLTSPLLRTSATAVSYYESKVSFTVALAPGSYFDPNEIHRSYSWFIARVLAGVAISNNIEDRQKELRNDPPVEVGKFIQPRNLKVTQREEENGNSQQNSITFDLSILFDDDDFSDDGKKMNSEKLCLILDKILQRGSVPCGRGPNVRCSKYVVWDVSVGEETKNKCSQQRERMASKMLSGEEEKKEEEDDTVCPNALDL